VKVDQFFDRLGDLLRSTAKAGEDIFGRSSSPRSGRGSGDPDLEAAFEELDDFLNREEPKAEPRREQASAQPKASKYSGPPQELAQDYKNLGVAFAAPFPEVRAAYKKMIMQYHPDKNSDNPEKLRIATEIAQKINISYQRIEKWVETGSA
jgi:DnaJ-domain-containing protein 1